MNHFSIRDIENLCGIRAHTLRTWEKRYQVFCAKRKSGNHRFYNNEDLKDLLRISHLYNSGYKISSIARMSRHEMNSLIDEKSSQNDPSAGFINKMLMASIDYDEIKFSQLLEKAIKQSGIETCILETFYPFLVRIGRLWLTSHVIPAQEHFSSYLIQNKIIDAIDRLPNGTPGENKKVIVFGLPEEFHEIPLLVALFFFRKNKIPYIYTGIHTSPETINSICRKHTVTHFYTHLVTNISVNNINSHVERFCNRYPKNTFVISGPGAVCISRRYPNLKVIDSTEGVIKFAKELSLSA